MTQTETLTATQMDTRAEGWLRAAQSLWFGLTILGQWTFVYFIVAYYFGATWTGEFARWNHKPLITGHVPGDLSGNLVFAGHVIMAAVMTAGGTLQLIPQLRERAAGFHRWNGRFFLITAVLLATGGLYLVWVRGSYLNLTTALGITVNALLIITFAILTVRLAMQRDIDAHRRWALRTFMVANGVWMLRVGMMFWAVTTRGAGMTRNMSGPFDLFWIFGCYLVPLAGLEAYLWVRSSGGVMTKWAMSGALFVFSLFIGIGSVAAYLLMWGPYI
ncbi:MAG: DUF2306 domain-containing protein [Myxococcota bacterium]